jgi:hypothetical protein
MNSVSRGALLGIPFRTLIAVLLAARHSLLRGLIPLTN